VHHSPVKRSEPARHILVVGATGALRPAAIDLATAGDTVVALARDTARLGQLVAASDGHVIPVPVDYRDSELLGRALRASEPLDQALIYAPTAAPGVITLIGAHVRGTVVHVCTSEAGRPGIDPPVDDGRDLQLLLGWARTGSGTSRWHTAEEISTAALQVLRTRRGQTLGHIRPWSARPEPETGDPEPETSH